MSAVAVPSHAVRPGSRPACREAEPSREAEPGREAELRRCIEDKTYRQIRGLEVELRGDCVTVSGTSHSYYLKQLVTQAVRATFPDLKLWNQVTVRL